MSVLTPKSYDGTDISRTAVNFPSGFPSDGLAQTPAKRQQRVVRVAGFWPRPLDPQPVERQITLQVNIIAAVTDASVQDLKALFSPGKGECALIATDGTIDWQLDCSVIDVRHEGGDLGDWLVTLQASYGIWRRFDQAIATASISAATTATLSAPNVGNERAPLILEATPTAVKGVANDQRYRAQAVLGWRAARGASNYPIAIQLNTAAEVTAVRMQSDGDDLRVLVDGREVDRWLGSMNANPSNIWINLDLSPSRSAKLKSAITNVSPATGGSLVLVDGAQLPSIGVLVIGTEAIAWAGKSQDGNSLLNITRGVRATTAASHALGDEGFLVEHQIDVVWGYTAAVAPVTDDRYKPILELTVADSDNAKWTHEYFATKAGTRSAEWVPTLLGDNTGMVALRGVYGTDTTYGVTGVASSATGTPTAVGAATTWQAIDDPPGTPDDDTTYASFAANSGGFIGGDIASPSAPPDGSMISVRVGVRDRLTGVGPGTAHRFGALRIGGIWYYATALNYVNNTAYSTNYFLFDVDPSTGVAWSPAGVAAIQEIGWLLSNSGGGVNFPIRLTQLWLSVIAIGEDDPAAGIAMLYVPGGQLQGHDIADAWVLDTPVGVIGTAGIVATAQLGLNQTAAGSQEVFGTDEKGRTVPIWKSPANGATAISANPNGPLYVVGLWSTYSGVVGFSGFSVSKTVLLFDTSQTPLVVVGAREDCYIHRWTLSSPQTDQDISILFPSAISKKLTIDTESGAVSYQDAGYTPLPGLSLDAPRLAWLEIAAGANALAWSDPTNGSGALTLVAKWRDRRS